MLFKLLSISCAGIFLTAAVACADDQAIVDQLKQAIELTQSGSYGLARLMTEHALENLKWADEASQRAHPTVLSAGFSETLAALLPSPPDGWSREIDMELSNQLGTKGGAAVAISHYRSNGTLIDIIYMSGGKKFQTATDLFSNEALARKQGFTPIKINGLSFYTIERGADKSEFLGLVGKNVIVIASTPNSSLALSILEKIDFDLLSKI